MKVVRQYEFLSRLQGDNKISPSVILTPEKQIKKEKIFLPFINERDNLGRLITHDIETKKHKNRLFVNRIDRSLPRKGVLSKIYNDSLSLSISPTKNESKMNEDINYSPLKRTIPQDTARIILSNNKYQEQNSKIEQNFERYNNHRNRNLTNEKKKNGQPQGSQMKFISPRTVKSQFSVPFSIFDVESSKNYIEKKNPNSFIIQEHNPQLSHSIGPSSPEKLMISPKLIINKHEKSRSEFKKIMADLKMQVNSNNLTSEEGTYDISNFIVPNYLPSIKVNNKFEDTRVRIHNLKVKINDVASSSIKEE